MIEINNLTTSSVDKKSLEKIAQAILKDESVQSFNLSIALIGPARMKKLNKQYRGKNRTTDVLAFGSDQKFSSAFQKEIGEIVICLQEVKKNAKRFNLSFKKELTRVLIHGILHLLGYDHEISKAEAKKMEEKEEHYLNI